MNTMTTDTYEIEESMSRLREAAYRTPQPSHSVTYWSITLNNRANELRNRVNTLAATYNDVANLEAEVAYIESAEYVRDSMAAWLRKNAGSAAVMTFIFGVIAFAMTHAIIAIVH